MTEITIHYTGEIVTREEAHKNNLKHFFTGEPCVWGHIAQRNTKNRMCKPCSVMHTKKWRIKNPLHGRECIRKYREKHPDWQRESDKKRYAANKEKLALKRKKHQKENPEMWATYARNRREMAIKNGGTHTPEDVIQIGKDQKWKCGYCRKKIKDDYAVDHIVPLNKGGSNDRKNLQILCPRCNSKKNAKDPIDFAREIGKLL